MTTKMKRALLVSLGSLAVLLAYLLAWPVPIDPVAWQPPAAPALEDPYAPNDALASVRRIGEGVGEGPEDVAVDEQGRFYVGYADGRIVRFASETAPGETLVDTGGRPLGLDFDPEGRLVIADGVKGLLRLDVAQGRLETLATAAEGVPFGFVDDVDVADNGLIYFSDASTKFGPAHGGRDDILEHGGHGRLLVHDPATGETRVLLSGLQFANGVALCPHQSCVLVNETGNYDVIRYWLRGARAGQHEVLVDNLPGLPDGISSNGTDTYWLALYAPRNAVLDAMAGRPWLRKLVWRLPMFVQPQPAPHAFVLGLALDGEVIHNLQHLGEGSYHPITSVEQYGDVLLLGSLSQPSFAIYDLGE